MTVIVRFPDDMEYRKRLKETDAFLIGDTEDLTKGKPEYSSLPDLMDFLSSHLGMANISNLDNIPDYKGSISRLFSTSIESENRLNYGCVRVSAKDNMDFPADLLDTDEYAYLFTNRNRNNGIQIMIGDSSGNIITRRKTGFAVTGWNSPFRNGVSYATFDIDLATGELVMFTDIGYSGANFSIENGELIITI